MINIIAYTDGSCNVKTRNGGAGVYILIDGKEKFISIGYNETTISRMEMTAVLLAIKEFPENISGELLIYSDSQFVVNSFNKGWLKSWILSDFENRVNSDIWREIVLELINRPKMIFKIVHTRGHQSDISNDINYGNSVADILANYKNFL